MRPLPDDVDAIYRGYLEGPISPPGALRSLVHAHLDRAATAHETVADVDRRLVDQIGSACLALLDRWHQVGDGQRRQIQAACLYFADSADGDDDFATIGGFDDDALVVNHVARQVGRLDLLIPVGPPRS